MKLLIGCLATETNSFSAIPTGRLLFEETFVSRQATKEGANIFTAPLHVWREKAEAKGWDVVESLSAAAQPAGTTIRSVYESYRDEILGDIEREKPDVLLMSMHGAMIAEGYDDCEGDFLTRARAILGPDVTIGLEIDPHCHLTEAILESCDLIVIYKEYPHVDTADRARELWQLTIDKVEGKTNPVMRDYDCRMLSMYMTPKEPVRSFVDEMMAREGSDGVLSLSLAHGFPWGNSPVVGTRMLAITDGDAEQASNLAKEFGDKLWSMRDQVDLGFPSVEEALDRAMTPADKPFVLADFADNAGAGAPADSTYVLAEVLKRGLKDVALSIFWDPVVVKLCQDAGVGATMAVRVGGKLGPSSGEPIDLTVKVRNIREGMKQKMGEAYMPMGTGVWLEADGVHLILSDKRTQCFHPSAFADLGLDPATMKILVVKSSNHFYAGFAPIAEEVIHMKGQGAVTPDMTIIPFTKRDNNFWPKTADPW